ncbi:hypothetical protein F5B20DRAFT_523072 [Whalleya microplaca]|nr:hypothetical protein F5B20DRAFT_523072 [Whalleya microplaca]
MNQNRTCGTGICMIAAVSNFVPKIRHLISSDWRGFPAVFNPWVPLEYLLGGHLSALFLNVTEYLVYLLFRYVLRINFLGASIRVGVLFVRL